MPVLGRQAYSRAACVVLTFVPMRWAHPLRTPLLWPVTLAADGRCGCVAARSHALVGFSRRPSCQAILLLSAALWRRSCPSAQPGALSRARGRFVGPVAWRTQDPPPSRLSRRTSVPARILEAMAGFWGHPCRSTVPTVGKQPLDLAVIGNCRIAALMDARGRILWWCFPRFDSDPVFSRLLAGDEEKGFCDVVLEGAVASESALPAQHGDRRDHASATPAAMPCASPISRRASSASSACSTRRRSSAASSRWPACRASRSGSGRPSTTAGPCLARHRLQPHPLLRRRRHAARSPPTRRSPISSHETPFALIKPVTLILGPDEPFEAAVDTASREFLERTRDYWLDWVRSLAVPLE